MTKHEDPIHRTRADAGPVQAPQSTTQLDAASLPSGLSTHSSADASAVFASTPAADALADSAVIPSSAQTELLLSGAETAALSLDETLLAGHASDGGAEDAPQTDDGPGGDDATLVVALDTALAAARASATTRRRVTPFVAGASKPDVPADIGASTEASAVVEGNWQLPRQDAKERAERAKLERALVGAVYDTERAYLALRDDDAARAMRIEAISVQLEQAGALDHRETVLMLHARRKRALFHATSPELKAQREDELLALALIARQLDDLHYADTAMLKRSLAAEVDAPGEDRALALEDLRAFKQIDESKDSSFCRRALHEALSSGDRRTARVLALALNELDQRRA